MSDEIKNLLSLLRTKDNGKVTEFIKKYETWFTFFSEIINSEDPLRTYPLVVDLKLVVLCGLAESLGTGEGPFKKFEQFINLLSTEEKLFFSLVTNLKQENKEVQKIWEQYLSNGNEELLKKLMDNHDREDDNKQEKIEKILTSYPNDCPYLEQVFSERINLLYGVRSKIVHAGSPVIGAMMDSSGEIIMSYGEKENTFFTIEYPIDEFFVRAACRYNSIEPDNMVPSIEKYCNDKLISRHARSETNLIYNLRKKFGAL